MRCGLVVPTLNAGAPWVDFLASLAGQSILPDRLLIIDSGSSDETVALARQAGFEVCTISLRDFDHAGVRRLGAEKLRDCEIIIFLTQDTQFTETTALETLLGVFAQPDVAAAYGRQIAYPDASLSERHARAFNYPEQSRLKSLADRKTLGIKTAFISNSFAAYRHSVLDEVGGFPARLIMGEDMYLGGKLLLAGWKIAYCAEAAVFHSHNQTLWSAMRRSFDIGVFHRCEPWLIENFKAPEKEGLKLVAREIELFWRECRAGIFLPVIRNSAKFFAYRLGCLHRFLPLWFNRFFSLNRAYWRVE